MARLPLFPEDVNVEDQEVLDANGIPFLKPSQYNTLPISASTTKVASASPSVSFQQAPIKETENTPIAEAATPQTDSDIYGKGLEASDLALAQSNAAMGKGWGEVLAGLAKAGSGLMASGSGKAPAQVDAEGFRKAGALGEEGVKGIALLRQAKDQELKRKKDVLDINDDVAMRDPNSSVSKSIREALKLVNPNIKLDDTVTGKQLKDAGVNLGTLLAAKMEADAKRIQYAQSKEDRELIREQKRDEARLNREKLSEKQITTIDDFDATTQSIKEGLSLLNKNSNFVGPVDSKVPDLLVGGDEAAFRASVGRAIDKYRKLITGAAASDTELRRIELRLPKTSDTFDNFKAKATQFIDEMEKGKARYLTNLQKSGKNTGEHAIQPSASFSEDVLKYANTHNITPEQAQAIKNKRLGK